MSFTLLILSYLTASFLIDLGINHWVRGAERWF